MKLVRRMNSHRLASAARAISSATIRAARRSAVSSDRISSQAAPSRASVRHASPNSNLRLKSMLFHAPVQRAAREPELAGGERDVEMMHSQCPLDHLLFELVEVEARADGGQVGTCPVRR